MTPAWPARLSPNASKYLAGHQPEGREMVCDVLDIASRQPWGRPQLDPTDPEGEPLPAAGVGTLTVVYWINRPHEPLYVLDIVWAA